MFLTFVPMHKSECAVTLLCKKYHFLWDSFQVNLSLLMHVRISFEQLGKSGNRSTTWTTNGKIIDYHPRT